MAGFPKAGIREAVPTGYRPTIAIQSEAKDYLAQGTSLLHAGRYTEAEAALREALRLAPDHPEILNNLGTAIWQQGRTAEASAYYLRAHQYQPRDFGILNNLGIILWDQGHPERAVVFYRRALDVKPDSFDTQMNLGVSLSDLGQFDEALLWLRSSLSIEPRSADAWDNVGMTLARQGHWPEAMECYDYAIELRPDFGEAQRNRALGWLGMGDFERGWPEPEWRFKCRNPPGFRVTRPRWTGEDLRGRTVLLHWEQGLGDTLQFVGLRPAGERARGRGVGLMPASTRPSGRPLPRGRPGFRKYDDAGYCGACATHERAGDSRCKRHTAGGALSLCRCRDDRALATRSAARSGASDLASVFKIGIAWQGNPENRVDRWRSFPLEQLAPLAGLPGVRLISLQKGAGCEQVCALDGRFPVVELEGGFDGREDRRDFLDTAAVMCLLDLVVTPETAVAHLAGGLGVRTWIALSAVGDWRWMIDGDETPWYASTQLFRQTTMGDWNGVFTRMADALQNSMGHAID